MNLLLRLYKDGKFFIWSRPGGTPLVLGQAGSRHSRDNLNTLLQDWKRPVLLHFSLHIIMKDVLVCLTFIRSSQPELREKNFPKVYQHIKIYLYMNSQEETKEMSQNNIFQCSFFDNLASMTIMYSKHSQQLKRNRFRISLPEVFCKKGVLRNFA